MEILYILEEMKMMILKDEHPGIAPEDDEEDEDWRQPVKTSTNFGCGCKR